MTKRHRIMLLGVKPSGEDLLFNPVRESIVGIRNISIVMGHVDSIRGFKERLRSALPVKATRANV